MIFRQAKSNVLRQLLVLSSCFTTVMSMAYLGLDMRTPKKCVSVDYAGAKIDLAYEIFGEFDSFHQFSVLSYN